VCPEGLVVVEVISGNSSDDWDFLDAADDVPVFSGGVAEGLETDVEPPVEELHHKNSQPPEGST
jgi:hypothetical protein